ncbi:dihydroxyacetone kinase family protein [Streptomyces rugosispiralis]|uniref:Dihydroxyacetone kinase family protein n=1 Tax=Streptomyces rugosispiralis TaxID=2967341 RepID=A0ABT1V0H9_9ACTN|nr:dihydroxyacetone kinase family protein [Streptomyces rugosispiralis]MCQ8190260.1 dihydroxyacetone kinase family protein [Streptomyces rugosispiralis]
MTRLWNAPDDFPDEMLAGFVAASGRWIRQVPGGVVRSTRDPRPTVSVVIGGGSGHYPAFGGLVGPGLAHGAAVGNPFSSPSARQVESVARAAHQGRGVLLSYGNYAGDVLHFSEAEAALRADGIDCRTVRVTDDIFSAPADRADQRRGIAGDFTVFRIAGAAAAAGLGLDAVESLASRANARTRSMGVAFSGCNLPGVDEPLFTVPDGRMAIGLGIHGEPGIAEVDLPTADGLAQLLVERLLADEEVPLPDGPSSARVVALLNGLGSVKYEELYVVYRRVAELLDVAGVVVADPHVGEYCTSFDMAGVSLTLLWLDDELERLWFTPADTPAFRTGSVRTSLPRPAAAASTERPDGPLPRASAESRQLAARIVTALDAGHAAIDAAAEELGRIDAVAGDGDHGVGMRRGTRAASHAAAAVAQRGAGASTTLNAAADAWSDKAGGTSGAIWGVILRAVGRELGDEADPTAEDLVRGLNRAVEGVTSYGKATVGDKTLVDALVPLADTFAAAVGAGADPALAWSKAAAAATRAAAATADLLPRMGRARTHGERSQGTPDPGAVSLAVLARVVEQSLSPVD